MAEGVKCINSWKEREGVWLGGKGYGGLELISLEPPIAEARYISRNEKLKYVMLFRLGLGLVEESFCKMML